MELARAAAFVDLAGLNQSLEYDVLCLAELLWDANKLQCNVGANLEEQRWQVAMQTLTAELQASSLTYHASVR